MKFRLTRNRLPFDFEKFFILPAYSPDYRHHLRVAVVPHGKTVGLNLDLKKTSKYSRKKRIYQFSIIDRKLTLEYSQFRMENGPTKFRPQKDF